MNKTPLTEEQKKWYLIGYMTACVKHLSVELKIDEKVAWGMLINQLQQEKKNASKANMH